MRRSTSLQLLRLTTLILLGGIVLSSAARAESSSSSKAKIAEAVSRAKHVDLKMKQLLKIITKLSASQKAALLAKLENKNFPDSDLDRLPDYLESSSGRCDSDMDDDGMSDGDEIGGGSDPKNPDSDGDGHSDANEVEASGLISAFESGLVTVADKVFSVVDATIFLSKSGEALSIDEFLVGTCVKIAGHKDDDANIADKVRKSDKCSQSED